MTFKNRYTQVLFATLLSFGLFLALRIFFYLSYFEYFSSLSGYEALLSFLMGFRVDTAIIFTLTSLLWLALLVPLRFTYFPFYRIVIGLVWGILIASVLFFNIGDILYFGFVNRHLSDELALIGNDVGILYSMAMDYYFYQSLLSSVFFLLVVALFYKLFAAKIEDRRLRHKEWLLIPLIIAVAFIGIRGKIEGISFGVSDAFAVNKLASGNLALSGFFCYYRGGDRHNINHSALALQSAVENVKKVIHSDKTLYPNSEYPLMRSFTNAEKKPYNVVIIMIESLSAAYLDALTGNRLGVTPTLDAMANNGLLFENFYANGQRSQEGITSLFTGITQPVGFENFGEGLELYNLSFLGKMAQENGYHTLAMQSSDRGSFRVDKLSSLAGFGEYYGAEDMPRSGDEVGSPNYGVWDGDMLRFLSSKLHTIKEPFISFAFSASTHAPYYSPGNKWEKYPHSTESEYGFLNTMNYMDAQIAAFMERAKSEPWFDNTIFIFTADHTNHAEVASASEVQKKKNQLGSYHIPLIIYAPKIFEAKKMQTLGSHVDILPTLADFLGWEQPFTTIGSSLFDTSVQKRFAFVKHGGEVALTDGISSVHYNFNAFMDGDDNRSKELQELLLSIDTAQANLLKQTKWMQQ
ncbi:MAG: LTA synthase family protein [Sulfurimonas sp.]|nr:LTA synthase family protein [Sulfurimonas sp.]